MTPPRPLSGSQIMRSLRAALRALVPTRLGDAIRARQSFYRRWAFHGDAVYQRLILELIDGLGVTDFVETGTYLGDSTRFVAEKRPSLRIASCEIDRRYYERAMRRLQGYPGVHLAQMSSHDFIRAWVAAWEPRWRPLFFLDAHWYDFWPLADELAAISCKPLSAVVVIDDMKVPGRSDFAFDTYGEGSDAVACDLELVARALGNGRRYNALLPRYSAADAFTDQGDGVLAGHGVVFQELGDEVDRLVQTVFFGSNYVQTDLPDFPTSSMPIGHRN
jgi:hypothetical protein